MGPRALTGAAGVSVTATVIAPGSPCAAGGIAYTSSTGVNYVCNGAAGVIGSLERPASPDSTGATEPTRATGPIASPSLGASSSNPAHSCAAILAALPGSPTGVYWLQDTAATMVGPYQAYCDMTTSGGGWTLVWSNLRGGIGKPTTNITWVRAINTLPIYRGTPSLDLQSFEVYVGLSHWTPLGPAGQLRYEWTHDYGFTVDERVICNMTLSAAANYTIAVSGCLQPVGNGGAGISGYNDNEPFSTWDADHTGHGCANSLGNEPWWYNDCWNGAMMGYGETGSSGNFVQGSNWVWISGALAASWGVPDSSGATGAGNGWMFVR